MRQTEARARLLTRTVVEARAFRNADHTTRDIRWGRVLGLLEAGTQTVGNIKGILGLNGPPRDGHRPEEDPEDAPP